ncbi:MAG TPA: glycosyltransferase family 4 protein [Solirubrobacteraceae bacterium]|nr:glycosyltransferase family 4 protein [Solirubrobacteraceae bacterium]
MRLLFVYGRGSRFVDIDRDALATAGHEIVDLGGRPHPRALVEAARADAVVCWFAGWHSVLPVTAAWLLRKPSVVITGGYDVAAVPDAGYGMQLRPVARRASRWALRRATRLMANSQSGAREARAVAGPRAAIDVVHHGVPDLAGTVDVDAPRAGALTVGVVDGPNLARKGLEPFVRAAALLPDVPFTLAGRVDDAAAAERLRAAAAPNVRLAGFLSDDELGQAYAGAAVYVQASRHEGFGMAVAEAMLAGCVPVVTDSGALPEVVGDAGVVIAEASPEAVADGVRRALALGPDARRRARERVLGRFTLEQRAAGLLATLDAAVR